MWNYLKSTFSKSKSESTVSDSSSDLIDTSCYKSDTGIAQAVPNDYVVHEICQSIVTSLWTCQLLNVRDVLATSSTLRMVIIEDASSLEEALSLAITKVVTNKVSVFNTKTQLFDSIA